MLKSGVQRGQLQPDVEIGVLDNGVGAVEVGSDIHVRIRSSSSDGGRVQHPDVEFKMRRDRAHRCLDIQIPVGIRPCSPYPRGRGPCSKPIPPGAKRQWRRRLNGLKRAGSKSGEDLCVSRVRRSSSTGRDHRHRGAPLDLNIDWTTQRGGRSELNRGKRRPKRLPADDSNQRDQVEAIDGGSRNKCALVDGTAPPRRPSPPLWGLVFQSQLWARKASPPAPASLLIPMDVHPPSAAAIHLIAHEYQFTPAVKGKDILKENPEPAATPFISSR